MMRPLHSEGHSEPKYGRRFRVRCPRDEDYFDTGSGQSSWLRESGTLSAWNERHALNVPTGKCV